MDGELSELETRMVHAHVARCAECAAYAENVSWFTDELRSTPLEELRRPVVVSRRESRVSLARLQTGIAAAVAVAVVGSVLQLALGGADSSSPLSQTPTRFPTLADGTNEVRQAIADGRAFNRHRSGSTDVI